MDDLRVFDVVLTPDQLGAGLASNGVTCAEADLRLAKTGSPDPVFVGSNLTYSLIVTNAGPGDASDLVLTDTLPSSVAFVSASGDCTNVGNKVVCRIGALAAGGSTNVDIVVTPNVAGVITNNAMILANEPDAVINHYVTITTTVTNIVPEGDDLTVGVDIAPITTTPGPKGITYDTTGMIALANNGTVYGMADFTLQMSDATKPPKPGKPLKPRWQFDLQFANLTFNLGANPSAKVNFYLSDDTVFDPSDTPLLKPGKEPTTAAMDALSQVFKTPKLSFKIPKSTSLSGKYVLVVIDFDDQVDESNENNNTSAIGPIP
jgi:uncharacterized repeat protein (TIGR01451 family)